MAHHSSAAPAGRHGSGGRFRIVALPAWILILPSVLVLPSACYTYTEVGVESVRPGHPVRIQVFDQAVDRLPAELERRTEVEGTVIDMADLRLDLLPELGTPASDPVSLAVADIRAISRRELSQGRTWAAVGVGAALGVGLLLWIEGEPASTGEPGPITQFMLGWTLPLVGGR